MYERVVSLENYVNELQKKVEGNSRSKKDLNFYGMSDRRSSRSNLRGEKSEMLASTIKER
jgi:hypothetical protein